MCDFPNVENNDLEIQALSMFCEGWSTRIRALPDLFEKGFRDEALILCCCYIETIGKWLSRYTADDREIFAKTLLRYGDDEIFGRLNAVLLLGALRQGDVAEEGIFGKLRPVLGPFPDSFLPREEIVGACRAALTVEEFTLLNESFWMGSLACAAHAITGCSGVQNGSLAVGSFVDAVLDFRLFYAALTRIFDRARGMIMAGKLRIW